MFFFTVTNYFETDLKCKYSLQEKCVKIKKSGKIHLFFAEVTCSDLIGNGIRMGFR